ncbi:MAG: COG2426 family protein [Christensenellaceae bacterium]
MKDILLTFLVAMVPVVELRGAIPFGVVRGLNLWTAIIASVLGNLVPVPFIILFIRRIFAWMRAHMPKLDGLVTRMEKKAEKNRAAVEKYAFWGLAILVAIPLPGTGAWTGALVAAMMEMRLKRAFPAIVIGVVIAGVIVSVVTYGAQAIFSF